MKESSADLQKTNDALLAEIGERRSAQETLRDRTAKPYAVCGIATDITELKRAEEFERKRAQEKLAQLNRTLQTLYQCNQALVRATEESELLQSVCRILVDVGGFRMAWVGYREADEKKAVRSVASAGYDDGYPERVNTTWADAERGRGPTGTAIRTGTVSAIQDIMTDPGMAPWRAEALNRRYAFSVALPLMSQGEAFGALALYAEEPDAFTESTIERYTDLANNLSYAVIALRTREHNRVAAEEKLRKRSEQLQKHRDVLFGLAHSDKSDFPKAIRQICSVSAATLNVARVSYWSLQENGSAIACEVLYLHEPESFDEQCKGSRLGFSIVRPILRRWLLNGRSLPTAPWSTRPRAAWRKNTSNYMAFLPSSTHRSGCAARLSACSVTKIEAPPGTGWGKKLTLSQR